ncbi:hypothetical protein F2Q70_00036846 [Brassica cretica]|uniref:Glycolipid transfer protein domain-containing protein n=1 Tax=Brassica cretica TaxID=69181 RepID=A0A8S9JRJ7_BRACR|nr:hypothetical protein F2Q70_00036846 [Brassica cretica]
MKRKRCEMEEAAKEKKITEIGSAIEELSVLSIAKTTIVTTETEATSNIINLPLKPLLSFCKLIIQVLDKIGPTMAVLRQDINQNIQRLEEMWESDPIMYSNLVEIMRKEANEGSSKKPKSCSRATLWLTRYSSFLLHLKYNPNRAMDFTLALLQRLVKDMSQNMEKAVEESYNLTIKPWHGWISRAAFKVALKLVPNNNTFINVLADKIGPTMAVLRQDINQNIQRLEEMWESDPIMYSNVVEIMRKEANEGSSKKPKSCSRATLWLTRAMDFTLALLQRLVKDMSQNMEQAVEESYNLTIKPWHGWISCAAFKVALKLVPNNNTFINVLAGKDESHQMVQDDIRSLISLLIPLVSQLHSILVRFFC